MRQALGTLQKSWNSAKNCKKTLKERSSKNNDPPRAIFNDFDSILEIPGDPKIIKKQAKETSKKEVKKCP